MLVTSISGASVVYVFVAIVSFLRRCLTCVASHRCNDLTDVSETDYRLIQRLLDPNEFEYLRTTGIAKEKIAALRIERRRLYRLCLRSLVEDFNNVHRVFSWRLAYSPVDRPDLVRLLAQQTVVFYCNMVRAEFHLALDYCGMENMRHIDVSGPVYILNARLSELLLATHT